MAMMLEMTSQQMESLIRYKKAYPHICSDKSDIDIMLYRCLITEQQAILMKTPVPEKVPKLRRITTPAKPKVRPYTTKQIEKMCRGAMKDFLADYFYGMDDIDEDKKNSMASSAAHDMAQGMLSTDERMVEYFRRSGVDKEFWASALADYFVE